MFRRLAPLLLACLWALPAQADTWTQLPDAFPRVYHRAIYDSLRTRMLVFGGADSLFRNDVHELTLGGAPTWNLLAPAGTPPDVRDAHGLVYDPVRDRMLLFGGANVFGLTTLEYNDVWALSLGATPTWTQLAPAGTKPAQRHGHTMIYDPVRDRLVVFGGRDVIGDRNDVWELSLSGTPTWTQLMPAGTLPTAREHAAAVYDPVNDRMIVFGGFDGKPTWNGQVWELTFSPLAWNLLLPAGTGPTARDRHAAIYDPVNHRMIVFGGRDGSGHWTNDVWSLALDGTPVWTNITPAGTSPPARWGHFAVYDSQNRQLVTLGGSATAGFHFADAWALSLGPAVGVDGAQDAHGVAVLAAGPNPARSAWSLAFRTGETGPASLRVYDARGRVVRDLWRGRLTAGRHQLEWDLRAGDGRHVPSGVYFYELRSAGRRLSKAITVIDF